jgi:hypothetical protein
VGAALVLAVGMMAPAAAQAQGVYFGGGITIPTGDLDDAGAETGWMGVAGFSFDVGDSGLSIGGEGFYGKNNLATDGDNVGILGAMGTVLLRIGDEDVVGPYVFGGAGLMSTNPSIEADPDAETESEFGYQFGAGLDIPLGGAGVWVEGRFMGSDTSTLFGVMAGVGIGIG